MLKVTHFPSVERFGVPHDPSRVFRAHTNLPAENEPNLWWRFASNSSKNIAREFRSEFDKHNSLKKLRVFR